MTKTIRASNMEVVPHVLGTSGFCRSAGRSGVETVRHFAPDLADGRAYRAGLAVASRWRRSCRPYLALVALVPGTAGSLVGVRL